MSSLSHILASEPSPPTPPAQPQPPPPADDAGHSPMPPKRKADVLDDESVATPKPDHGEKNDADELLYTATTTSTRTNKNGATSSVYSGNKIKHLKKEDGIPLWRKDIQYDFLKLVFYDQTKCFTKYSDKTKGHTFADVYIDAMAKSSKCSKILKEKLLQDQEGAITMAMVCLLVNVGRMNTTLNFFPEMRAQLRTYHSIPALQAHQDPNAYKQLQDAPRLKSILKGATEDEPQPSTMEDIKAASIPRTNPVNLIFVMSQYAPKISEVHFPPPRDFFDLVMRSSLSSESRARAFLWLIWWYLESDFSVEDAKRNPFGAGQYGEGEGEGEAGTDAVPMQVPTLESLTDDQAAEENVDTEAEQLFGEQKRKERIAILASEPSPAMTALKRARKEKGLTTGHNPVPSDDEGSEAGHYRSLPTSVGKSALHHETGSEYTRSPSPAASRGFQAKRHRGVTQHQSAVINHRKMQIDYNLDRRLRHAHNQARDFRESQSTLLRSWKRIRELPSGYDSEEESIRIKKAKDRAEKNDDDWRSIHLLYAGFARRPNEPSDVGEEAKSLAQSFRRASRRLERWQEVALPGQAIINRRRMEERGMLRRPGRESRKHSLAHDGVEILDDGPSALAAVQKKRGSAGRPSARREQTEPEDSKMDVDPEPDDDDGGAELDEEDRELLGEVDADEDEDEDEDEEMED
ncbi:uncharacterized protein MYCFIDRAFT_166405 [Pseudocercospora fijiensis CIRAD86]|uniref:Ino eighty subunit 1 n=1 Tax=Pseudocercospora fijiensis (strain CIRAD86) TaxID=383855 RepID=M2YQI4_PSEFD|nr:uncharacterized protein MYCFIDRAFT_166405 [Pseudocercospora fijiensis CIRAD86]EME79995.1 hypothetical protein MYCFIDRAFT_166405 [Pseudocercospora fijiensis CIRAD86]